MLLKHPSVVGEQQLQAESECKDQGKPKQCAEDQSWHHGLALGTEGHVETGHNQGKEYRQYLELKQSQMINSQAL